MKKFVSVFMLFCLICLCFSACKTRGANAQIVLPIDNEPQYLDPQILSDSGSILIMQNCMEGLLKYNAEGELVCAAAESYDVTSDGLKYLIKLRKDGKWRVTKVASGVLGENFEENFDTRVTANDFAFAIQRALAPETLCPLAGLLLNIKGAQSFHFGKAQSSALGINIIDDYTLEIIMQRKDDDFPLALASSACLPCNEEYFNKTGGRYGLSNAYLIYNGPFYISNWSEKTAISLRRNDMYHNLGEKNIENEVMPKSIYVSFNNELSSRTDKLIDKKYTMAPLTNAQAEEINDAKKVIARRFDSSVKSVIFNCSDELMSNTHIRQALAYGIDYNIFDNLSASSIIASGLIFENEPIDNQEKANKLNFDINKAGKLYKTALEELEKKNITLTFLCPQSDETLARTIIQSWQSSFGVTFGIEVEAVSDEEFQKRIENNEYQLALYDIKFTQAAAKLALDIFRTDSRYNIFNYNSAKLDKLIDKIYIAQSGKEELSALKEAEDFILKRAVAIPLQENGYYVGLNSKSKFAAFSPDGHSVDFKEFLDDAA